MNADSPPLLFKLGQVVATPGALRLLSANGVMVPTLLARHVRGDWGAVSPPDARANVAAVREGLRILSIYPVGTQGDRVWVITEADRSATTMLLPEEY